MKKKIIQYLKDKGIYEEGYTIKVDKYNIITIHPIKNSWNREEVEKKLMDLANVLYPNKSSDEINMKLFMANWIKDNLK